MTKDNYPFVTPKIANLAKKYGFDGEVFGVYEKGYTWDNKKIKAKLFRSDLNIKNAIEIMKDSRIYEAYLKRPGMFEGNFTPPIWMIKAPLYSQLIDWFYGKHHLYIEILKGETFIETFAYKIYKNDQTTWLRKKDSIIYEDHSFAETKGAMEESIIKAFEYLKKGYIFKEERNDR